MVLMSLMSSQKKKFRFRRISVEAPVNFSIFIIQSKKEHEHSECSECVKPSWFSCLATSTGKPRAQSGLGASNSASNNWSCFSDYVSKAVVLLNSKVHCTDLPDIDSWVEAGANIHHNVCTKNLLDRC